MLLTLEPRGQQSRAMLWFSPLLAALLTLLSGALLSRSSAIRLWRR